MMNARPLFGPRWFFLGPAAEDSITQGDLPQKSSQLADTLTPILRQRIDRGPDKSLPGAGLGCRAIGAEEEEPHEGDSTPVTMNSAMAAPNATRRIPRHTPAFRCRDLRAFELPVTASCHADAVT